MRFVSLALCILAGGCFFKKETAQRSPELHQGGMVMLEKCGYAVTTPDGASRPETSEAQLGADPTPRFVRVNVASDPSTAMAILWRTKDEDTRASIVQYGESDALGSEELGLWHEYESATAGIIRTHETHLCGLKADTEYHYRVGGRGNDGRESWSPIFKFRTAPPKDSTDAEIVVLVIGDTRDGYSTWGASLAAAFEKATPDLILFSGDATTLGPIQEEWDAWFTAAEPFFPTVPFITAHGNHDVNAVNFFSQFAHQGDEQNFAVQFGPAHLTVANDTPRDQADLSGAIAQKLEQNLALGTGAPWRILLHHKPMWSASAGPHVHDAIVVREAWGAIVDAAQIDLTFSGHDHNYERTKPLRNGAVVADARQGTTYFIVGSAGASLYDNGRDFWTEFSEKTYSFGILRLRRGMARFDAYRSDGSTLDQLTLTK